MVHAGSQARARAVMQAPGHAGSWGLRAAVAPEVQLGSPVTQ
ncbi:hypothetical protein ACFPRL_15925 [Pseudoclavibacter helvolus]